MKSILMGVGIAMASIVRVLSATDYAWDVLSGNSAIDDGSGTWDTIAVNWTPDGGSNNVLWPNNTNAIAQFNGNVGGAITVSGSFSAGGISFSGPGVNGYTFSGPGGPTLTLGAGGLTVGSATGAQTLDSTLALSLSASQSWINNSAALLTVNSPASAANASTLTVSGTGDTRIGGPLADGAGWLSLTKSGSGTLTLSATNSYSGATTVSNGTLAATAGTLARLNVPGGTANIHSAATATEAHVSGGQLKLDGNVANTLKVTGGTVTVGPGATVGTADFSAGTGTVNSANPLTLTDEAILDGKISVTLGGGGPSFTLSGTNILNPTTGDHRTITASGGTLAIRGPTVPTQGLIGMWTFDDGTAGDSSGNGYDGIPVDSPAYDAADVGVAGGRCLVLNGASYVKVDTGGSQAVFDGGSAMTISAWVKGWPGTWSPFVSKYGENGQGWQHRKFGNSANLAWTTRGLNNQDMASLTNGVANGEWHLVTMTYDASAPGSPKRIYVDGALDSTANTAGGTITATGAMLGFGARQNGAGGAWGSFFNGKLDDISFYNRALSDDEVKQIYAYAPTSDLDWSTTDLAAGSTSALSLPAGVTTLGNLFLRSPGTQLTLSGADATRVSFDNISITDSSSISDGLPISLRVGHVTVPSLQTLTVGTRLVDDTPAAALTKLGDGTLTLTGSSTYTGGTIISAGTLQLGDGGTAGSIANAAANAIANSGVLTFNRSDTVSYANPISGEGAVRQIGTGSVILAGTNTYSGSTVISSGVLYLNGSNDTPAISVAAGAALGGSGSAALASVAVDVGGSVEAGSGGSGSLALFALNFAGIGTGKVANVGDYTDTPAIVITQDGGLTLGGGTGSVAIALSGLAPFGIGTAHLIQYDGAIGGTGAGADAFQLDTTAVRGAPHARFALTNRTGYMDVDYSVDNLVWSGAGDGNWTNSPAIAPVGPTPNWRLASTPSTGANFVPDDTVLFDDSADGTIVTVSDADVEPAAVTFNNSTNGYALQGVFGIAGRTSLTKLGSNVLTIATDNSYSGGTLISAGTLQVGAGGTAGTLGSGAVRNDAILAFNRSDVLLAAHAISGAGSLIQRGAGTLVLEGPNRYSGGTTVNAGTLRLGHATALGAANSALTMNGGSLDSGVASLVLVNNNPQAWNADFTFIGTQDLDLGGGAVSLGSTEGARTITVDASVLTVGGPISDGAATALTKAGDGTLILSGANTYSGPTTVNAGILQAGTTNAFGPAASASLAFGSNSTGRVQLYNNSLTLVGLNTDPLSVGAPILENGGGSGNITLTIITATDNTFAGTIQDGTAGSLALIKSGAERLTLSGANTYTGGTSINGGILSVSSLSASGQIAFNNGGILEYIGAAYLGTFTLDTGSGSDFNIDVTNAAGNFAVQRNGGNYNTIVKGGPGTLTIANGYWYDGGAVVVNEGTVVLSGTTAYTVACDNVGRVDDVKPGAILKLGTGALQGQFNAINGNNTRFHMSGGTFDLNGNAANSTPVVDGSGFIINSAAGTTAVAQMFIDANKEFSGDIQDGAGTLALIVGANANYGGTPTGKTWTVSGSNTYSGATTLGYSDTLMAGSTTAFSPHSAIEIGNLCSLDLAGYNNQIAGLTGIGTVMNSAVGEAILTVSDDDADYTFGGVIRDGVGKLGLTKAGSNALTLAGANAYTGDTKVLGGRLNISQASLADAADVYLATGVTLGLDFSGTDTIRSLSIDNHQQWFGTWGGIGSGAEHISDLFSGPGRLRVTLGLPFNGMMLIVR